MYIITKGFGIMPINENTLEQVIISKLQEKGYEYLYGPDIERDYHEVILKDYFDAAFHKYLVEGVPVTCRVNGGPATFTVHLVDFENPEINDFKVVNQYTVIEYKNKRPDALIFINGIPMALLMSLVTAWIQESGQ